MGKKFHKSLLLCPSTYSISNSFAELLGSLSDEYKTFDIRKKISNINLKIRSQIYRLPFAFRREWEARFFVNINKSILEEIKLTEPDLVFVYNSEFLLPDTCALIKKKAKLIFFLGDSPFFTPQNDYYLTCLKYADLILAPDSFWIFQLNTIGVKQTLFFVPGLDASSYNRISNVKSLVNTKSCDIIYTGACYLNSWGYKKVLLMNQFTVFDFMIYGNSAWKRWFSYFPELESHYNESGFIPVDKLNIMFNKAKLMPVDGNPAIFNGFHIRMLEALGSGVLPLVEYRSDVENFVFKDSEVMVPFIRDYSKARDLANYYLRNDNERAELASSLRSFIVTFYSPVRNSERIIDRINSLSK